MSEKETEVRGGLLDLPKVTQLVGTQSAILSHVCDLPPQSQSPRMAQAQRTPAPPIQLREADGILRTTSPCPRPRISSVWLIILLKHTVDPWSSAATTQGQAATSFHLDCYLLRDVSSCTLVPVPLIWN